jgi:hypothetical protein
MTKTMTRAVLFGVAVLALAGCGESGRIFGLERGGPDEFTVVRNPPLSVPPQATLRPPARGETGASRNTSSSQARDSLIASGVDSSGSAGTLVTPEGATPYNGGTLSPSQPATQSASNQTPPSQTATTAPVGGTGTAGAYPQTAAGQYGQPGLPIRYGAQSGPSIGEAALARRATAYYGVEPDVRRKVDAESAQLAVEQEKFLHKVLFWMEPEPPGTPIDAEAESRRLQENDALGKPANSGEAPVIARKKSGVSSLF